MPSLENSCNTLQNLFDSWRKQLIPGGTQEPPKAFYEQALVTEIKAAGLATALFDTDKFPALADLGIALAPRVETVLEHCLPSTWTPSEVRERICGNSLAQILLAYIWKLGKFQEVSNIVDGYYDCAAVDASQNDENAVVMRQFGRHLASPTGEPIFDQHTVRFFKICTAMSGPRPPFRDLLVANVDQPSTKQDRLDYVSWWRGTTLPNKTPMDQVWADRIMFSLGKAAKTLGRTLANADQGGEHSKNKGKAVSKLGMAQELVALNSGLPIAEMRPLLMEKLKISERHANTYFYNARRRLGLS